MNDKIIQIVNRFKFLGSTIDHYLYCIDHVMEFHVKLLKTVFLSCSLFICGMFKELLD